MECLLSQCVGSLLFQCHSCLDCGALHRHTRVPCEYPQCGLLTPTPPCRPLSHLTHTILDHRFQHKMRVLSAGLLRIWQQLCVLPHVTSWLPWAGGRGAGSRVGVWGREGGAWLYCAWAPHQANR